MVTAEVNPNLTFLREKLPQDDVRIVSLRGGARSGKTYSTLQYLIELSCQYSGITIDICRQGMPSLKSSVMKDFFNILKSENLYVRGNENKTDHIYTHNGNEFSFFSLDDEQKVRGKKRDILYVNEGNEAELEIWKQLQLRTTGKTIIDYNPSMHEHWIYEDVEKRNDCTMFVSTYMDNPHLTLGQIEEMERYKIFDEDYYNVFGLGHRGKLKTGAEFYPSFSRSRHVKKLQFNEELPVHLTFDFNVLPYMTMLCCQIIISDGIKPTTTFRFFKEYCLKNPDNSSIAATQYFARDFDKYQPAVFYYGDASGKSRIAGQGNKRNFDDIESGLLKYINSASDKVLSKNPNVFKARDFINHVLAGYYPDIFIEIDESCVELIKDMENVKISITGKDKEKFNDKALGATYEKYGHTSDALTYLIVSALLQLYKSRSHHG